MPPTHGVHVPLVGERDNAVPVLPCVLSLKRRGAVCLIGVGGCVPSVIPLEIFPVLETVISLPPPCIIEAPVELIGRCEYKPPVWILMLW